MQKIEFTDSVVRKMPCAPRGQYHIFEDTRVLGLKLVVLENCKTFVHVPRLRDPRVTVKVTIGVFPEINTEAARKVARHFKAVVGAAIGNETGADQSEAVTNDAGVRTLAVAIEDYLQTLPTRRHNKRASTDQAFIKRYMLDPTINFLLTRPMPEITVADAGRLINAIARRRGPAVASSSLVKLRTMCNWAMRHDRQTVYELRTNPFAQLRTQYLLAVEDQSKSSTTH